MGCNDDAKSGILNTVRPSCQVSGINVSSENKALKHILFPACNAGDGCISYEAKVFLLGYVSRVPVLESTFIYSYY